LSCQWGRTDHPFQGSALEYVTNPEFSATRFDTAIDRLESDVIPKQHVFNPVFEDLVADPISTVQRMYDQFDLELNRCGACSHVAPRRR
jgi:hypothetical protein